MGAKCRESAKLDDPAGVANRCWFKLKLAIITNWRCTPLDVQSCQALTIQAISGQERGTRERFKGGGHSRRAVKRRLTGRKKRARHYNSASDEAYDAHPAADEAEGGARVRTEARGRLLGRRARSHWPAVRYARLLRASRLAHFDSCPMRNP